MKESKRRSQPVIPCPSNGSPERYRKSITWKPPTADARARRAHLKRAPALCEFHNPRCDTYPFHARQTSSLRQLGLHSTLPEGPA
jgi:hypothetical protein